MSSPNLLITGVTGFIGFKVLLDSLTAGYTVRAAVRSISQSQWIPSHPRITALGVPDKLSFVEVPDIIREGAYDQAVKDITYIIHLASPLPSPGLDPQTGVYEPNVKSATSILHSAIKEPSIKKVVITFSVFSNILFPPDGKEITEKSRLPDVPGPFDSTITAYSAGKIGALNAAEKFIKDNNPKFAVVKVMPGLALGYDERATALEGISAGTNRMLLGIITGKTSPAPFPAGVGDVADVAKVHLLALGDGVVGSFGVTKRNTFDEAWEIVKRHFPKAIADGIFTQGSQPTIPVDWNAHQTEVRFGFDFKTYEDAVVEVANQYLQLSGKKGA
ncbi:putative cinnamoyl-CoA reductase [Hypoxylon trugodes]|uniref:putative cinnamoyl-CoA reductase n=1 Tax=Hypoxylon trugodes TaxID=326681 RepID=UPI00218DF121|nr:putative cinnamoyl-CoA reductase [Hypoxylon trugodes]KAI1382880.1 putative cinnamoyl-CoA reductase [Hypoxylon trugodes]